jgi:hypothetical protein
VRGGALSSLVLATKLDALRKGFEPSEWVAKVRLAVAKTDTILAHCIARGVVVQAGGEDLAKARYGENAEALRKSKWRAVAAAAKATPRASRVASFICMWALALDDLDRDEITVDEYAEWANESRATAFRRQAEYREMWADVEINELARRLRDYVRSHRELSRKPNSLMSIPVAAPAV